MGETDFIDTITNLAFVPTIIVALKKKHYTLAFLFFITAAWSAILHGSSYWPEIDDKFGFHGLWSIDDYFSNMSIVVCFEYVFGHYPVRSWIWLFATGIMVPFHIQMASNGSGENLTTMFMIMYPILFAYYVLWHQQRLWEIVHAREVKWLFLTMVQASVGLYMLFSMSYKYSHSIWHVLIQTVPIYVMMMRLKIPSARSIEAVHIGSVSPISTNYGSMDNRYQSSSVMM